MINRGLIRASGGGSLILNEGDYDNLNSLIVAEESSSMTLRSGVTITNGTIQSTGSGTIQIEGTVTMTDVSLQGTIIHPNFANFVLVGDIDNQANINMSSVGNFPDIVIDNDVNLFGWAGTITMSGGNLCRITDESGNDGVLTNVDHLIQGSGRIGADALQFVNEADGEIHANNPASGFILDPRSGDPMINRGAGTSVQWKFPYYRRWVTSTTITH